MTRGLSDQAVASRPVSVAGGGPAVSRRIAVLDAPSNLGLRPPSLGTVPGCAKAPGALRDHGLVARLGARDAGCVTPPRYDPTGWQPGDGVCQAEQIAEYTVRLADRIGAILDAGEFPVVLGGDCSIVLGAGWRCTGRRAAVGGRIGLVFVDGHSDFRHPGNASVRGRGRRRGPGPGHRPGTGGAWPGSSTAGPTAGRRRGGDRDPGAGRVPDGSAGRRDRRLGRCRSCGRGAGADRAVGPGAARGLRRATGCTWTWTCWIRR